MRFRSLEVEWGHVLREVSACVYTLHCKEHLVYVPDCPVCRRVKGANVLDCSSVKGVFYDLFCALLRPER